VHQLGTSIKANLLTFAKTFRQVTKRKFPSRAAAALAHYFFASRIGRQRGQRMAARVADRLRQALGNGELRF
jgi:hypothetical protein